MLNEFATRGAAGVCQCVLLLRCQCCRCRCRCRCRCVVCARKLKSTICCLIDFDKSLLEQQSSRQRSHRQQPPHLPRGNTLLA